MLRLEIDGSSLPPDQQINPEGVVKQALDPETERRMEGFGNLVGVAVSKSAQIVYSGIYIKDNLEL